MLLTHTNEIHETHTLKQISLSIQFDVYNIFLLHSCYNFQTLTIEYPTSNYFEMMMLLLLLWLALSCTIFFFSCFLLLSFDFIPLFIIFVRLVWTFSLVVPSFAMNVVHRFFSYSRSGVEKKKKSREQMHNIARTNFAISWNLNFKQIFCTIKLNDFF